MVSVSDIRKQRDLNIEGRLWMLRHKSSEVSLVTSYQGGMVIMGPADDLGIWYLSGTQNRKYLNQCKETENHRCPEWKASGGKLLKPSGPFL